MDGVKNLILDKVKERVERFGFKKTTMDEISKDCRISKKTIYEHFIDKEDMFRCLVVRERHNTIQILFSEISRVTDPIEKITLLVQKSISYFNQDNFITKVLKDDDMVRTLADNIYRDMIDKEVIALIAGLIREGKQQGVFREVDEEVTAYAGYKLFQAFTYGRTWPLSGEQNEEYYAKVLIDFMINAIRKD